MAGATAVFLTHRRGTAIAIWDLEAFVAGTLTNDEERRDRSGATSVATWLDAARRMGAAIPMEWEPTSAQRRLLASALSFVQAVGVPSVDGQNSERPQVASGLGIWLSSQPTAETLWLHFRQLLHLLGLQAVDIGHVVFGGGPVGSFTGLRLGAAFAGGLALGRGLELHAVPTFVVVPNSPSVTPPRFANQAIEPIEVFAAMATVLAGGMVLAKAESLLYASEPGPVLTLQNKSASNT